VVLVDRPVRHVPARRDLGAAGPVRPVPAGPTPVAVTIEAVEE
jgi:hypothetical protein